MQLARIRRKVLSRVAPGRYLINHKNNPELRKLLTGRGVALIGVPKTASTSTSFLLYGRRIPHLTWRECRNLLKGDYRRITKIAVIRDPVDRFLSAFDYLSCGGMHDQDAEFARRYVLPTPDINGFIEKLTDQPFASSVTAYYHFCRQTGYVSRPPNICMVNHLVAFENLSTGLPRLLKIEVEDIPKLNVTRHRTTAKEALSARSMEILSGLYEQDFRLHALALCRDRDDLFQMRY